MCFFFFCLVKWQTREINASRQAVILSTTPARSWLRILWMTMELDENENKYVQPSFLWFSLKTEMNFWEFLLGFAWFLFYMWTSMNIIPGNSKNCKMSILIFISVAYARQFLGRNQYYPAHGMLFPLMQGAKWGKKECVVQSKSHYNQCKVHLQISLRWDKVLCRWAGFAGCSSLQWWIKAVTKFLEQIKIQMILFPKSHAEPIVAEGRGPQRWDTQVAEFGAGNEDSDFCREGAQCRECLYSVLAFH